MKTQYIKANKVKSLVKSHGKRTSKEFLASLDRLIERKVREAVAEHNGGKKTLDASLAAYVIGGG